MFDIKLFIFVTRMIRLSDFFLLSSLCNIVVLERSQMDPVEYTRVLKDVFLVYIFRCL